MKILITGISGFVGTNFILNWREKYTLFGLDIRNKSMEGVENFFLWNDFSKIPEVDVIVHLAGKAHDTKNQCDYDEYFKVNTELTKQIFDYFLESKAKKFFFFSSVKAAADSIGDDILTEEITPSPVGPYGESKIKAEEYILEKLNEAATLDKNVYIIRPCLIHGPGNKGNLNLLYNIASKRIPWPLGAYENKRSFCSVDNASYLVEQIMINDGIPNGIYNIGDDEPLSTNELIKMISKSVGKNPIIWKIPEGVMSFLSKLSGLLHLPLNEERLKKLTENYVVSNEKIKMALNVDKLPVSAKEGMLKTLQSLKI